MSVSNRIVNYLAQQDIRYQLVDHAYSHSSIGSAISAEVPLHHIAKAIVLNDDRQRHLMAVLPADYKISLHWLNEELGSRFRLSKEAEVYRMFSDCDQGAVPPLPGVYDIDAIVDPSVLSMSDVYLEAGDHQTLLHMQGDDFEKLMQHYSSMRCGHRAYH